MYFGSESFVYMNRDKLRSVFLNMHSRMPFLSEQVWMTPLGVECGGARFGQASQGTLSHS